MELINSFCPKNCNFVRFYGRNRVIRVTPLCFISIPLVIYSLRSYFSFNVQYLAANWQISLLLTYLIDTLTIQKAWIWLLMDACKKKTITHILSFQDSGGWAKKSKLSSKHRKMSSYYGIWGKTIAHFWGFENKGWVGGGTLKIVLKDKIWELVILQASLTKVSYLLLKIWQLGT